MTQPREATDRRRRFLVSGLSMFGFALSLGSVGMITGCGDDKGGGQLENKGDVTKTPDAQDSMKAYMDGMQKRTGKKK